MGTFGILENWLRRRDCRLQEMVATRGSLDFYKAIVFISCNFFLPENHDVTYYELPSIYGHDTFLLDVVAVGAAVKVGHVEFKPARNCVSGAHF